MKKIFTLFLILNFSFLISNSLHAQVLCILCFNQNDSISPNVTNLLQNGGFENGNCGPGTGYFCPNSSFYSCDFPSWTCTGGGTSTYAHNSDANFSMVIEGTQAAYMGNYYCNACSNNANDTSCLSDTACTVNSLPPGFPNNTTAYGGTTGVSLEQTVTGLTPGNIYVLEFWAGGEGNIWPNRGLFGVDVGFGDTLLRCKQTSAFSTDIGIRYIIEFMAASTSHTIKFTNWGHICADCTELILDDVKLYTLAQLSSAISPCPGITPIALFSAPHHICPGTCTDFTNLSLYCNAFQWTFTGATPSTSTDPNPTNICYNTPGSYSVSLIGSNATTSDTLTLNNYLTVYPYPPPQGIAQNGDTLFANQGAVSYQWYQNGNSIAGATDYYLVAPSSGDFNVVATDANGCEVEAVIFNVIASVQSAVGNQQSVIIHPNPVEEKLEISNLKLGTAINLSIYNIVGEKIYSAVDCKLRTVDCGLFPSGLYYLEVTAADKVFRTKFVKQ